MVNKDNNIRNLERIKEVSNKEQSSCVVYNNCNVR